MQGLITETDNFDSNIFLSDHPAKSNFSKRQNEPIETADLIMETEKLSELKKFRILNR